MLQQIFHKYRYILKKERPAYWSLVVHLIYVRPIRYWKSLLLGFLFFSLGVKECMNSSNDLSKTNTLN